MFCRHTVMSASCVRITIFTGCVAIVVGHKHDGVWRDEISPTSQISLDKGELFGSIRHSRVSLVFLFNQKIYGESAILSVQCCVTRLFLIEKFS